jgi:hypothetical protein
MLYLGHFSFDKITPQGELRHGNFDCLADSNDPEMAVVKFRDQIRDLKRTSELFEGISSIFLDDLIEIKEIPQEAIVTRFQSASGAYPRYYSYSLPSDNESAKRCEAYKYVSGGQKHLPEDKDGYKELQPFMEFPDGVPGV